MKSLVVCAVVTLSLCLSRPIWAYGGWLEETPIGGVTLGLFTPDGRGSCACVYPHRVNGEKAKFFDPLCNDQDWALVFYLDQNPDLVETVANVIIQNTSGPNEADDFWSRAEQNLLLALLYYVVNKRDSSGKDFY